MTVFWLDVIGALPAPALAKLKRSRLFGLSANGAYAGCPETELFVPAHADNAASISTARFVGRLGGCTVGREPKLAGVGGNASAARRFERASAAALSTTFDESDVEPEAELSEDEGGV